MADAALSWCTVDQSYQIAVTVPLELYALCLPEPHSVPALPTGYSPLLLRLQEALGKQLLSTNASSPLPGFGSSQRPALAQRAAAPGPGAYRSRAALGEHLLTKVSTIMIAPSVQGGFVAKTCFCNLYQRAAAPGPGAYKSRAALSELGHKGSITMIALGQ